MFMGKIFENEIHLSKEILVAQVWADVSELTIIDSNIEQDNSANAIRLFKVKSVKTSKWNKI